MSFLLVTVYWVLGFVGAIFAATGMGFLLSSLIALLKLFSYRWTWAYLLMYLTLAGICVGCLQLVLLLAGTIGDRTQHKMQTAMLVGAVFPGILALIIPPRFVSIALRQTNGRSA